MSEPQPILFLDIDGVCNDHAKHPRTKYCRTKESCVLVLDRILVETDCRIVLTSAWRYLVHEGSMNLQDLANLLHSHWIDGDRLIGITRRDIAKDRCDRGPQITEWLANYEPKPVYCVLDDLDLEITSEDHPFVDTDGSVGLTDVDANHVIKILMGRQASVTSTAKAVRLVDMYLDELRVLGSLAAAYITEATRPDHDPARRFRLAMPDETSRYFATREESKSAFLDMGRAK